MKKSKEDIYIQSLLEEVGRTLTGEDALNIIATRDTHAILEYCENDRLIQYIITIEWDTYNKQFMVLLNIKENDTFLINNIILSYTSNKFYAEKSYNAWIKEIKTKYPTKFFCQRTCQFYEISMLN